MRTLQDTAIVLLAAIALVGAAFAGDIDSINAALDTIQTAHETRNIDLLAAQCWDDCAFIAGDTGIVLRKAETLAGIKNLWQGGLAGRELTNRRIAAAVNLAFVRMTTEDRFRDGKSQASEHLLILTRSGARWQVCFAMPVFFKAHLAVSDVKPDSPAEKAGIKADDMIVACNGESLDAALLAGSALKSADGSRLALTVRRSEADIRLDAPAGLTGAAVEPTLVPTGPARFIPAGESHPVKELVEKEIQALRTGDADVYSAILHKYGFFSYRREGNAVSLVTTANARPMISKQITESRRAIKPDSIDIDHIDVIAAPNVALASADLNASSPDGTALHVRTRLHVYVKSGNAWYLVADLVERFRLAQGGGDTEALTPEQTIQAERAVEGKLVGIGVKLSKQADAVRIENVLPGTPAEKANLRAGQSILAVDGRPTKGMSIEEVVNSISGAEGTQVTLELVGSDGSKSNITLTRGVVKLPGVAAQMLDEQIGRLNIAAVNMETPAAVRQALTETFSPAGGARAFILDLRNNTGGVYSEVVKIAQMLIDGDPPKTLWTIRQNGKDPQFAKATSPALNKLPCVVVIDQTTSGAAELLAEALQEQSRATLVGFKTAGAAVMKQRTANADGTSNTVQIGDFLFPKTGRTGRDPVVPDVLAPSGASPDQVFQLAVGTLHRILSR